MWMIPEKINGISLVSEILLKTFRKYWREDSGRCLKLGSVCVLAQKLCMGFAKHSPEYDRSECLSMLDCHHQRCRYRGHMWGVAAYVLLCGLSQLQGLDDSIVSSQGWLLFLVGALAPKRELAGSSLRWIPKRVGLVAIQMCGVVEDCLWSFCNRKTPWNYSWGVGNFFPVPGFYLVAIWPKLLKAT